MTYDIVYVARKQWLIGDSNSIKVLKKLCLGIARPV